MIEMCVIYFDMECGFDFHLLLHRTAHDKLFGRYMSQMCLKSREAFMTVLSKLGHLSCMYVREHERAVLSMMVSKLD